MRAAALAILCVALPLTGASAAAQERTSAARCSTLAESLWVAHTTITSATLVAAGAFTVPPPPGGGAGGRGGRPPRFDGLPAFCRVTAISTPTPQSNIGIEIWLPASGWNGMFQATGWAFWGGAINPAPLAQVLRDGYATATTDGGHQDGNNASFAIGHGEKLVDWSERAWHETTVTAKAAIAAFYGRAPNVSYWNACGGGTRQGLTEIQLYPGDYDAVAAGGLSHDTNRFTFTQSWMYDVTHKDAASYIPASKLPVLKKGALAACDALDGAADGIIGDPRACRFDPGVLTCRAGDADDCLTAAQVTAAKAIYAGPVNPRTGARISGGMTPGSEPGWNAATAATQQGFNIDFFRNFVFQDPGWDPKARPLDYDADVARASVPILNRLGAMNPDISAFLARGGKLLMYGGWNDTAIPTTVATGYYESVVRSVGSARAQEGVRLFMIPDMGHCPAAGDARDGYVFDPMPVLRAWKEEGRAPSSIVVRHRTGGSDDRTVTVPPYAALQRQDAAPVRSGDAATQVIADAVQALGGRDRVLAVKRLTIDGYGSNPNIGQQMRPETEPLLWMIPDFHRVIDLEHGRMLLTLTRRPAFPAVFDNARTVQGLDGDAAYNVGGFGGRAGGPPPAPVRVSDAVARERRLEMLHHPLTAIRAALDPAAKLSNVRVTGTGRSVDITTRTGETITLAVDTQNRPISVASAVYHVNLGDVVRTTTFEGYEDAGGVRLPKRLVTTLDRWTEWDIGVMKNTVDGDEAEFAAGGAVRTVQVPPSNPPQNVMVTEVAKGIWFLTGAGVPSLVVEFADHVAIVEVPVNEARTQAVIAKAKELVPGKPLTQAIVTHHHFDHTGGLRAAVAEGLTIITHRVNEAWFRDLVRRKHTITADALAKSPKPLKIVAVDDTYTIKDRAMEMQLQHLVDSTHGDGLLAVYFPAQRVYAEPDVWNPGAQIQPHVRSLNADITRRGLQIERIVPLHGTAVQPYSEFLKIVREWTGVGGQVAR